MRASAKLMALGAMGALLAGPGAAWSQPQGETRGGGMGQGMDQGMGHGTMGHGTMGGPRHGRYADVASYLDGLKAELRVTAAEEPAWNEYAGVVKAAADEMRSAEQPVYAAMNTATWQERRDMMNRLFERRQQAHQRVQAAAEKLLPSLTPAQRTKAGSILPGLRGGGRGMTHHGRERGGGAR